MNPVTLAVLGYMSFVAFVIGFFWVLLRQAPTEPFMDPAIREDREVEALEVLWAMPSFDPREQV